MGGKWFRIAGMATRVHTCAWHAGVCWACTHRPGAHTPARWCTRVLGSARTCLHVPSMHAHTWRRTHALSVHTRAECARTRLAGNRQPQCAHVCSETRTHTLNGAHTSSATCPVVCIHAQHPHVCFVYARMCVCVGMCVHLCGHECVCLCVYTSICVHTHPRVLMCLLARMHCCPCTYMCACVHACVHARRRAHRRVRAQVHICVRVFLHVCRPVRLGAREHVCVHKCAHACAPPQRVAGPARAPLPREAAGSWVQAGWLGGCCCTLGCCGSRERGGCPRLPVNARKRDYWQNPGGCPQGVGGEAGTYGSRGPGSCHPQRWGPGVPQPQGTRSVLVGRSWGVSPVQVGPRRPGGHPAAAALGPSAASGQWAGPGGGGVA